MEKKKKSKKKAIEDLIILGNVSNFTVKGKSNIFFILHINNTITSSNHRLSNLSDTGLNNTNGRLELG